MDAIELHVLIEKEGELYSALCLELDVASQGPTPEEAKRNLQEAILLYLEDVYADGGEAGFVPRPAPHEEWVKYFEVNARNLGERLRICSGARSVILQEAIYG